MSEKRDNSGIMFRNPKKDKPTHADYRGQCMIAGVEYWVSGWIKDGQKGKFMSFAFTPKDEANARKDNRHDEREEIPF